AGERRHGSEGSQIEQELAHEAVEGRKTRDRHRSREKREARPRHPLEQAAELLEVPGPGRVQHRSGPEEEQALEEGVIEYMKETSGEAEDREGSGTDAQSNEPEAETQGYDPHVLDAAVREETFQVVLGEREENAQHAGRDPHADQQPPCPRRERTEEREGPDESVDPRLDH